MAKIKYTRKQVQSSKAYKDAHAAYLKRCDESSTSRFGGFSDLRIADERGIQAFCDLHVGWDIEIDNSREVYVNGKKVKVA